MTTAGLIKEGIQLRVAYSSRFSTLSSWRDAWWHAGRHVAGEVAESSIPQSADSRKRVRQWTWLEYLRPQNPTLVTHFLPQDHTS